MEIVSIVFNNFIQGIINLIKAIMFFVPHYKTELVDIELDNEIKTGTLSGLRILGCVILGELIIKDSK